MPAYPHIERYQSELNRLLEYGGSDSELSIRPAFQGCLDAYCREHREKLALVPELRALSGVVPDGTVKDTLRMARGYWEAKDSHDDLDAEITRKFDRGYPRDNIIFEDSRTAVLIQNREEAMRADMSRPGDLHRLIRRFLDYELPQIEEFRQAQSQFKADLPAVLENLRQAVEEAEGENESYRAAAADFLDLCRQSISPEVSEADVREMLLQHILTKDIFLRVFAEDQFHRENDVAQRLDALEHTFFTGGVRRQAIDRLRAYYGAIGRAADEIADYAEKQHFLKAVYEDFYKAYNPAAADRLGVVYTPNEVVDFIIRGTDYLLKKHFGRTLADDNVQILDPATGTGTFITSLIDYLPTDRLEYKYLNEIHANEVAILPYYIANLNIEYTYKEKTGRYLEFPNLCFVDTLDNMDWQQTGATGGAVTRQSAFNLGGLSVENWMRVQLQNEKTISVIIGNPPYNANQQNENDNNRNREYPEIDRRIKETYIEASTAQKTKQYDMYKRFIRWASDRLADDGIVAFITNRKYLDARQDDGFRKVAADEFSDIYVLDLGSDVRRNPKISGTTHNVFGIQTGVAIGFFVRDKSKLDDCNLHYARREDAELAVEKLEYLRTAELDKVAFEGITSDLRNNWLSQSNPDFEKLMPIANRQTKLAKRIEDEQAVFGLYSLGVVTNRDEWVYDFDEHHLLSKIEWLVDKYEQSRAQYGGRVVDDRTLGTDIKWTRDLKRQLRLNLPNTVRKSDIRATTYRPFTTKYLYYNQNVNEMQYQMPQIFPHHRPDENKVICFLGSGARRPFAAIATNKLPSLAMFIDGTQCLPFYRYTSEGERVSNITDWGVRRINDHYREEWGKDFDSIYPDGINAEEIFAYTYAVLHDPVYRHDYAADLLREFPRLPLYHEFDIWARMGRELLDLHLGFESIEPYPLKRVEKSSPSQPSSIKENVAGQVTYVTEAAQPPPSKERIPAPSPSMGESLPRTRYGGRGKGERSPRARLRADKERGIIVLDDQTSLTGVPPEAWRYRLGNRSALEWVLDQYKEKKPRDPTIRERFNTYRFADHKERVIELLQRVCAVSVKTMDIVDGMAYWDDGKLVVFGDRDKHEWGMMGLAHWSSEPEDEEWLKSWLET